MIEHIPLMPAGLGTQRALAVHRFGRRNGGLKVYIQSGLHADEIPGLLTTHHLLALLHAADAAKAIQGEIVVVPVANPIGSAQILGGTHLGRRELRSGLDFNRHWYDLHAGLREEVERQLTEDAPSNVAVIREALGRKLAGMTAKDELSALRLALGRLAFDADILLDLHCDDDALMHVYMMPQHWPKGGDLPAELGAAATLLCDDSGSHCFDETFALPWTRLHKEIGDRFPIPPACFIATVELRGQADVSDALASKDAEALFRFLIRRGAISGEVGPLPAVKQDVSMLDAVDMVEAPLPGVVAYKAELGARVKKGDVVAELVDPLASDPARARQPLRAECDGLVVARCIRKLAAPGDQVMMVVGQESLAYRRHKLMSD